MFHAKGAHTWRSKLVTLGEETRRRMRNTDRYHNRRDILEILKKFSQKLTDSGYDASSRQEILRSGLRKSYRDFAQAKRDGVSVYRTRQQMDKKRELKTLMNKPWFRRVRGGSQAKLVKEGQTKEEARIKVGKYGKEERCETSGKNGDGERQVQGKVREVECVVFVPATPGSKLRDTLQKNDDNLSKALDAPSLRFVEKGGTTIQEKFGQSDPWKGDTFCQREDCLHCQGR